MFCLSSNLKASCIRNDFLNKLDTYLNDMKQYKHLKSKLESRRLDYDAKLNRIQKAKKEKPELDEEMRAAAQKYSDTLTELETLMVALNECEVLIFDISNVQE
jgi:predicted nuclease with TOPRIM domain